MKKIFCICLMILGLNINNSLNAIELNISNNYCNVKPYPVSNKVTRTIQGGLGLNYFTSKIAEGQIKKQLEHDFKGKFFVDLVPYSAFDLMAGKFKNFNVKGNNVNLDGLNISAFEIENLCDFVYLNYKKQPMQLLAPMILSLKGEVSSVDIQNTLTSNTYGSMLKDIKLNGLSSVSFINPIVKIDNNKLLLSSKIHLDNIIKDIDIPVNIELGVKLVDNKIIVNRFRFAEKHGINLLNILAKLVENTNPVIFDFNKFQMNGASINMGYLKINNDKIQMGSKVFLPKNYLLQ